MIYVGAVLATELYGTTAPQHFGDLGSSLFTLFQVMTGEAWPDIARTCSRPPVGVGLLRDLHPDIDVRGAEPVHRRRGECHGARTQQELTIDATLLAEIRALRAEIESLRAERDVLPQQRGST